MTNVLRIPDGTQVVVADGTGARLFEASTSGGVTRLRGVRSVAPEDLANSGPSGSRPPEQTEQQTDEATFAKQLSERLYDTVNKEHVPALVLFADPQTLGQLRDCMHQSVSDRIARSFDKTLTNSPIEDIEKYLNGER